MRISNEALASLQRDPDFASYVKAQAGDTAAVVIKSQPGVGDVHVASASSGDRRRRKKPAAPAMQDFAALNTSDDDSPYAPTVDAAPGILTKTFAEIMAGPSDVLKQDGAKRWLKPHADGGAHVPFPWDAQALDKIPPDQVRRFFSALTDQDALPQRSVPVASLVAMQPRVSADKVESMQQTGYAKLPLVVRNDGKNYIADGTHRASAMWLEGEQDMDCRYCDLDAGEPDQSLMKVDDDGSWEVNFKVAKVGAVTHDDDGNKVDLQQIFGVAALVQEGDYLVVDKQDDMIMPEDLAAGVHEYVLECRHHGDMHQMVGTGRLIESLVITPELRKAYAKHGYTLSFKNEAGEECCAWLTGFQIDDVDQWAKNKSGERPEFSIGGRSMRTKIE